MTQRRRPIRSKMNMFMEKVSPEPNTGCWLWMASLDNAGYGQFWFLGTMMRSSRVSWLLFRGSIPKGKGCHGVCVLHKCDVRACVNPDHLFLGTHQDNVDDREAKGRGRMPDNRGALNGLAKLTDDKVREIRTRYKAGGVSQAALAKEFGVARSTVSMVTSGRLWKSSGGRAIESESGRVVVFIKRGLAS